MGMFDYVLIEVPIEGIAEPSSVEWQTKEFDAPFMEKYKITDGGRLLREIVHYEDRSDKSAEPGSFASFAGAMTPVHDGWRDIAFHGDLEMCGQIGKEFVDVKARFHDGDLTWIRKFERGEGV